jgi:hypothetical protein
MSQGNWNQQPPPGSPPPGQPAYPSLANYPAPGPMQQQPPPAIPPGYPAPVAPPMPGGAPQGQPNFGVPAPMPGGSSQGQNNFGAYQPPSPPPAPMPPGYMPQGAMPQGYGAPPQGGYGAPPGQPFAQPGAPAGGFSRSARRFSGADMAGVKMSGLRNPFLPLGMYVLEILRTMQSQRKGSFVVEVRVVWTNSTETQVGAIHTWVQSCADLDVALPKIKRFTVSALGFDKEEQAAAAGHDLEQVYTAITDAEQQLTPKYRANPLAGSFVNCSVEPPRNRPDGTPGKIPGHNFSPVQRTV